MTSVDEAKTYKHSVLPVPIASVSFLTSSLAKSVGAAMHLGSSVTPATYVNAGVWSPPGPHSVSYVQRSAAEIVAEDRLRFLYGEQVNPMQSERSSRTTRILPPPLHASHGQQQLASADFELRRSGAALYGTHLADHDPEQHFQDLYTFNRPSSAYGYYQQQQQQQQHWTASSSSLRSVIHDCVLIRI